jgi:RimJ/RimL family protein N-acetyltransferase
MVIKQSAVELELHSLLKKSSLKESRALGLACIAWAFSHPVVLRVTAYIIEGLEAAKNYCLKLGFKQEGCRRCACVQGGIIKDVYMLGMTRQEWRTA